MLKKQVIPRPKNPKVMVDKRRQELLQLIEDVGTWNVTLGPLAEKYGVSVSQISQDITKIKKNLNIPELKDITLNVAYGYKKAVKEMLKILKDGNKKEKMEAARALTTTVDGFTRFLEDYKLKEKVAERLDIDHKQISIFFDLNANEYPKLREYQKIGSTAKPNQ